MSYTTLTNSLSEDIAIDILTRLPVKSILRFKSVSKHWSTLPTAPQFVAAHLRRSASNDHHQLIVQHSSSGLDELKITVFDANLRTLHDDLQVPVQELGRSTSIIGSCNGLVCIEFSNTNMMFWNPATKQHKLVPEFDLKTPFSHLTRYVPIGQRTGFGFVASIDDYKAVKVAAFYTNWKSDDLEIWDGLEVKAVVFSWKNWSWKVLKNAHIPPANYEHHVAANEHLYWVGCREGSSDFVLAFNLVNDSFRTIELSDHNRPERGLNWLDMETRVSMLKSRLSLGVDNEDEFVVYVIGENGRIVEGVKWDVLFKYGCFDDGYKYEGYWNGRHQVIRRGWHRAFFYLFDPETNGVRWVDQISAHFYGVLDYVESLVPVIGVIDDELRYVSHRPLRDVRQIWSMGNWSNIEKD
ncbi:Putative F-box protein At3g16210 [Linum perenne]